MKVFIKKSFAVLLIFILSLLLSNCSSTGPVSSFDEHENKGTETYSPSSENKNKEEPNTTLPIKSSPTQNKEQEPVTNGVLEVHYIDVGQGDSILIHLSGKTMLIDAGNNVDGASIITYIKTLNIDKIDAIVATHPHADHIGGMAEIINEFVVDKIYMPKVAHTSKTYENLLLTIKNKNLKVNTAKAGTTIDLGNKIKIEVMAPNRENYDNLNDYSAVVKIEYENVFSICRRCGSYIRKRNGRKVRKQTKGKCFESWASWKHNIYNIEFLKYGIPGICYNKRR